MAATVDKEDQLSHGSSSKKGSDRLTDDFQLLFRLGDPLLDVCLSSEVNTLGENVRTLYLKREFNFIFLLSGTTILQRRM